MCTYTALATATVIAEFPAWGLEHCMAVFDLQHGRHAKLGDKLNLSTEVVVRLTRLATLVKVDTATLVHEFNRALPLAFATRDSHPGCSSSEAWTQAMHLVRNTRHALDTDSLYCTRAHAPGIPSPVPSKP